MRGLVGCVLTGLLVTLGMTETFESDLARALQGAELTGADFHRTVLKVMDGHSVVVYPSIRSYICRTIGDPSMRLLWVSRVGFTINDTYVIWRQRGLVHVQRLARSKDDPWLVARPAHLRGNELVFCGNAQSGANWIRPCIRVYRRQGATWTLKQNLYAAGSKEGRGELNFALRNGRIDISRADGTVRDYPSYLNAPHVGPLLVYDIRFERVRGTYRQTRDRRRETPLAALEDLARFRAKGMKDNFNRRVPFALRDKLWTLLTPGSNLLVSTDSNLVDDESPVLQVAGHELRFVRKTVRWVPKSVVQLPR